MLGARVRAADTSIARPPPKAAEPFYLSPEWRALRLRVLARDRFRCAAPGCARRACVVDHIVSRKAGGADAEHNLRSFCRTHDNQAKEDPLGRRPGERGG